MNASFLYPRSDLDEIDIRIVEELYEDGRRSNARIAAALGVSVYIVKKRIERLLRDGIIAIQPLVNPERLGYTMEALIGISAEPARAAAVAEQVADVPGVSWVAQTMGRYSVLAEVVLRHPNELFDLVTRSIAEIPGVQSTSTFLILRQSVWIAGSWHQLGWLGAVPANGGSATQTGRVSSGRRERRRRETILDELDHNVLSLLMADGRRPAAEIARIVGVSTSTVTARLERLIESGVCSVIGLLEPEKVGFNTHVFIGIHTDPTRAALIGEELTRAPQVFWVAHLAGWYDILADVWLRDAGDLSGFLAEHIAPIEGVRATEAFWLEELDVDNPFGWGFDDSMALRRKTPSRRAGRKWSAMPDSPPEAQPAGET